MGPPAPFDPNGSGYDYRRALQAGMGPNEKGHWGSVAPVSNAEARREDLPGGSYAMLKGTQHPTHNLGVEGEYAAGNQPLQVEGGQGYSLPINQGAGHEPGHWDSPGNFVADRGGVTRHQPRRPTLNTEQVAQRGGADMAQYDVVGAGEQTTGPLGGRTQDPNMAMSDAVSMLNSGYASPRMHGLMKNRYASAQGRGNLRVLSGSSAGDEFSRAQKHAQATAMLDLNRGYRHALSTGDLGQANSFAERLYGAGAEPQAIRQVQAEMAGQQSQQAGMPGAGQPNPQMVSQLSEMASQAIQQQDWNGLFGISNQMLAMGGMEEQAKQLRYMAETFEGRNPVAEEPPPPAMPGMGQDQAGAPMDPNQLLVQASEGDMDALLQFLRLAEQAGVEDPAAVAKDILGLTGQAQKQEIAGRPEDVKDTSYLQDAQSFAEQEDWPGMFNVGVGAGDATIMSQARLKGSQSASGFDTTGHRQFSSGFTDDLSSRNLFPNEIAADITPEVAMVHAERAWSDIAAQFPGFEAEIKVAKERFEAQIKIARDQLGASKVNGNMVIGALQGAIRGILHTIGGMSGGQQQQAPGVTQAAATAAPLLHQQVRQQQYQQRITGAAGGGP